MCDVRVGMAEIQYIEGEGKLSSIGLGSSIAVVMVDRRERIASMGHFMLPDSNERKNDILMKPAKYGDTCIRSMKEGIIEKGGSVSVLIAKAAGGASLFRRRDQRSILDIARKNIYSMIKNLSEVQIPLVADELGGVQGRSVTYDLATNDLAISSVNREDPSNPMIKII